MRIVFSKLNAAILAVGQSPNGDVIIDPAAIDIYPSFNPTNHGTFTTASFPSDLEQNILKYMVDSIPSPVNVIEKFHIEVTFDKGSLVADGNDLAVVTVNIKDSLNVLQNVSGAVNLFLDKGFLGDIQVTIAAGTGTTLLYSSKETVLANVIGYDANPDTTLAYFPVPGFLPSAPAEIPYVSNSIVTSPNAPGANPGLIAKTFNRVFFAINFVNAGAMGIGTGVIPTDTGGSYSDDGIAIGTAYDTGGGAGNEAGFETAFDLTSLQYQPSASLIFRPPVGGDARFWAGIFSASPTGSATPSVSYIGIRFDPDNGDANFQALVDNGSGTPTGFDTGFAPNSGDLFKLDIYPNLGNPGEFIIKFSRYVGTNNPPTIFTSSFGPSVLPGTNTPLGMVMMRKNTASFSRSFVAVQAYLDRQVSNAY